MVRKEGFSILEIAVVIVIVSILAGIVVSIMQGRIDEAKWSEANATAGAIRRAVRIYAAETNLATAQALAGNSLENPETQEILGFDAAGLEGTYFTAADYIITSVDASAVCVITVAGSKANAPSGSYRLTAEGRWLKQG